MIQLVITFLGEQARVANTEAEIAFLEHGRMLAVTAADITGCPISGEIFN